MFSSKMCGVQRWVYVSGFLDYWRLLDCPSVLRHREFGVLREMSGRVNSCVTEHSTTTQAARDAPYYRVSDGAWEVRQRLCTGALVPSSGIRTRASRSGTFAFASVQIQQIDLFLHGVFMIVKHQRRLDR